MTERERLSQVIRAGLSKLPKGAHPFTYEVVPVEGGRMGLLTLGGPSSETALR
jgi:hypothetical protein